MYELCYQIKEIPDLTLGKYDYLSERGVDGVVKLHNNFLCQLHEKSRLSNVSIHFLYIYSASAANGDRIKLFFILKGDKNSLDNVDMLIRGTTLSEYFCFSYLYFKNLDDNSYEEYWDYGLEPKEAETLSILENSNYNNCCILTKEEVFFTGGDGTTYYNVPKWKPTEKGRLYEMLRMMRSLNEDCAYRVDLTAVKKNRSLRKTLTSGPIPRLHALQNNSHSDRDYGADTILRSYDELMTELDSSPHFQANVFSFSKKKENGSILLASAVSEALEEGDYHISSFEDNFTALSFLNDKERTLYSDEFYKLTYNGNTTEIVSEELENSNSKVLRYLPTLFTYKEISSLVRFPCLYDGETIEMRKETVAPVVESKNSIYLGKDENGYDVYFPIALLPKHAFVSGVPGSGKTNTMHHLTYSLWTSEDKIPFLVLEPAKREYRTLCNMPEMSEVRLFSPGSDMSFPLHINPFEMPNGISVSEHIRTLCEVFEGAFPLENPMPFLLDTAIEAVYRDMKWRPEDKYDSSIKKELPTMSMLYKKLEQELEQTTYSGEVKGNLESALKVRIGSLLRREMGDVFDVSKSSLTPEEWLKIPAIVELEAMGRGPANFMTLMLCSLIRECLKINNAFDKDKTRHVIFIEEAHNLIGEESEEKSGSEANPKTAATAFIVKMLAEVRALRESVFIADQLPTAMAEEVIKNTGLKIGLRLTAMDDRQLLCNSMSANSSQIEEMGNFKVGEALISYEGLQRPFKMRIHEYCGDIKDKEKKSMLTTPKKDKELLQLFKDNDGFNDSLERSIEIEIKKHFAEYQSLYTREKMLMELIDEYHKLEKEYDKYLSVLSDTKAKIEQLSEEYNNDETILSQNKEYLDCKETLDLINFKFDDIDNHLRAIYNSDELLYSARLISDLVEFASRCLYMRNHFKRLGVSCNKETKNKLKLNFNDNTIDKTTKAFFAFEDSLIQPSLDLCYIIYNAVNPITPLSKDTRESILSFSKIFGVDTKLKIID